MDFSAFSDVEKLDTWKGYLILVYVIATFGVLAGVFLENDKFSKAVQEYGWRVLLKSLAVELVWRSSDIRDRWSN